MMTDMNLFSVLLAKALSGGGGSGSGGSADDVSYDNTTSGLTASDVQDAIDEIASKLSSLNVTLTQDEYDLLPAETKNNGSYYFIVGDDS